MIPYSRNPDFVGRETILQRLNDRFASLGKVHARVALFGLGGVGLLHFNCPFIVRLLTGLENLKLSFSSPIKFERSALTSPYFGYMPATLIGSVMDIVS